MKKLLFLLLYVISTLPIFAQEFYYEYEGQRLTYTVIDEEAKTCKVSGWRWPDTVDLVIPETTSYQNVEYSVIAIGDNAFEICHGLTSVTIPNSVTSIGDHAFSGCDDLISVTIPNSVTSIGDCAFASTGLTSVTIPNSVTSIGDGPFSGCQRLLEIFVENGNQEYSSLDGVLFKSDGTKLIQYPCGKVGREYIIPNTVTSIGDYAFYTCFGLTSVTIPNSATSIGGYAFYCCAELTSVTIPNSVTSIGDYAFNWCEGLTSVTIPNSVTSIGDYAFVSTGLTSVTIPNSVTTINHGTFSSCDDLTEVIFPPSIEKIGESAFRGCFRLETIIMGPNLKEIEDEAFSSCKISNIYITTPTPPALPDGLSNFFGSPEDHRTTFFQNEAIRENYKSELWDKYVFLLEEGGKTALMVEPKELRVEGGTSLTGRPGDTFRLSAKLYPEDATLPYVFWRSTDPEIASVDSEGLVTIHADLHEAMPVDEGDESQVACKIIAETLYYGGPVVEIPVRYDLSTGIHDITDSNGSSDIDPNAPAEVFTLQGTKVSNSLDKLSAGIYIVRQGNKVKKISVR